MSDKIVTIPSARDSIGKAADGKDVSISQPYRNHLNDITEKLNTNLLGPMLPIPSYTVATLPSATGIGLILVSDETGGAVLAFSDETNWRRSTDRAVVS